MQRLLRRVAWLGFWLALGGFAAINLLAWFHTHAMTNFAPPGAPRPAIEQLSFAKRLELLALGVPVPRPVNHFSPADSGYAYDVHRLALPDDKWLEAWSVVHPQPRGVALLFHGYAASKQQVLLPTQVLYEMGYSVFLVDFRGHGGSSGATTTLGMGEAEDVAHALTYVQQTWPGQPTLLYGTSMGSTAILRAAATEPITPTAIIAETPFARLTDAVGTRVTLMGLPTFPITELLVFWGGVQHDYNGFSHNPVDYARSIATPTVLLHGAHDTRVSVGEIAAIYAGLQGPKALITVPDVGHTILLPQTPEVQQQVAQFLAAIAPGAMGHKRGCEMSAAETEAGCREEGRLQPEAFPRRPSGTMRGTSQSLLP